MVIQDASGYDHMLSRYYAMWNMPRPESYVFVCFLSRCLMYSFFFNYENMLTLSMCTIGSRISFGDFEYVREATVL